MSAPCSTCDGSWLSAFPSGMPSLKLPILDPTHMTALHAMDFGEVFSPDGRAHPFDGETPVVVTFHEGSAGPAVGTSSSAPATTSAGPTSWNPFSWSMPEHLGARLALGVLAIGVLLLVAWRLSK